MNHLVELTTASSMPMAVIVALLATSCAIVIGALLDRLIGDPRRMPHLVRGVGHLIAWLEGCLHRPSHTVPDKGLRRRGLILVILVVAFAALTCLALLMAAWWVSPWLGIATEAVVCFQCLAVKSLRDESTAVQASLEAGQIIRARRDVAMIVGRDTADLDSSGVARAGVETVAENTADAVVAPLLAMLVAGGTGAVVYKAVNTMDSMIGYRNERYLDFGRAAAKLDDVLNWVPSRFAALMMVVAARLTGLDWRRAWQVWRRDHDRHASPNSAQTESACAGALGVELGGPATYHGDRHDKPVIGAPGRAVVGADIVSANRLMSVTSWLSLAVVVVVRLAIVGVILLAAQ
ncbi:MAG: adenosylcobinamide-phosphate synthase CbiB [Propionibacteriaceae bacterium]|jgi:adenosylcobinamide-phosphate synthase|nr:adenosylcobinamide-phosphate synthase CbiB [Propionibacteriaceae bacterium]